MSESEDGNKDRKSSKSAIIIAVITAVSGVAVGIIGNLDKISDLFKEEISGGYAPTRDFETEYRYFHEVSGGRRNSEKLREFARNRWLSELSNDDKISDEELKKLTVAYDRITLSVEDQLKIIIPIMRRFYSIDELVKLNELYSTVEMRRFVERSEDIYVEQTEVLIEESEERDEELRALIEEFRQN